MRFRVIGTKTILEPTNKEVEAQYLARPEKYTPVTEEPVTPPAADPLDSMTLDQLKAYAAENNIDLGNATSENGIRKKIKEAGTNDPGR